MILVSLLLSLIYCNWADWQANLYSIQQSIRSWSQVCNWVIMADLFITVASQIICSCRTKTRGCWPGNLLWHGGSVGRASQQVVQTAMGSIIGGRFQTQKIWEWEKSVSLSEVCGWSHTLNITRLAHAHSHENILAYKPCEIFKIRIKLIHSHKITHPDTQENTKICLTTHDIIKLNVFKGWNFGLEFKCWSIPQENSLKIKVDYTGHMND